MSPQIENIFDIYKRDLYFLTMVGWENRDNDACSNLASKKEILIPRHKRVHYRVYSILRIFWGTPVYLGVDPVVFFVICLFQDFSRWKL